ncbi:MAG: acyl carrier protein [Thermoanaerobaculia bacterium]
MSDTDSTRDKIVQHLIAASDEQIDASKVTDQTSLRKDLDLSSLQAVTLVMDLEDEFGVTIEDEEIESLDTVGDVLAMVIQKQEQLA